MAITIDTQYNVGTHSSRINSHIKSHKSNTMVDTYIPKSLDGGWNAITNVAYILKSTWHQIEQTHLHEGGGRNNAVDDSKRTLGRDNRQWQAAPAIPGGGREGTVATHAGGRARSGGDGGGGGGSGGWRAEHLAARARVARGLGFGAAWLRARRGRRKTGVEPVEVEVEEQLTGGRRPSRQHLLDWKAREAEATVRSGAGWLFAGRTLLCCCLCARSPVGWSVMPACIWAHVALNYPYGVCPFSEYEKVSYEWNFRLRIINYVVYFRKNDCLITLLNIF